VSGRPGRGWKAVGEGRRGRKARESNGTLQYLPLKTEPSRPKWRTVINKIGRSWSLVPTHITIQERLMEQLKGLWQKQVEAEGVVWKRKQGARS